MTVIDRPLRRTDRKRARDRVESWPLRSDADLWEQIDRRQLDATAEAYRRHGHAAYSIALAITADRERAQRAVVSAFGRLLADDERAPPRTLRLAILAATRRYAGLLAEGGAPPPAGPDGGLRLLGGLEGLAPDARDVLALAVAGRCGSADIAAITGFDLATVRRHVRVGLHHVGAALDRGATSGS